MAGSDAKLALSREGALAMAFREYLLGNLDTSPSTAAPFMTTSELEALLAPWGVVVVSRRA